jgi:ankyrin repeat protein
MCYADAWDQQLLRARQHMSDWELELSRELTLAHRLCTYTQYWVIKRSEEEETVKLLLELGANVHAHIMEGYTPLHLEACYGQFETAKVLVEFGANLHAKDENGDTPLHTAATQGSVEAVNMLVE